MQVKLKLRLRTKDLRDEGEDEGNRSDDLVPSNGRCSVLLVWLPNEGHCTGVDCSPPQSLSPRYSVVLLRSFNEIITNLSIDLLSLIFCQDLIPFYL